MVLKPLAEKVATFPELEREIKKYITGEVQLFFPIAAGDYNKKLSEARVLVDGYLFIHVQLSDINIYEIPESIYFEGLLCEDNTPCIIPDSDIERMKKQVEELHSRDLGVSSKVKIVDGVFKGLKGTIKTMDLEKKEAVVTFSLTSKTFDGKVSLAYIELLPEQAV